MKNKLPRFLRPSMRLYFILLLIFAALSFFFTDGNHILALSEAGVIVLLAIYTRFSARRSADKLSRYIEDVTGKLDEASQDALTRSPLPIVVFDSGTLNLLWCNDLFYEITGSRERFFEVRVSDIVPDFTSDWLMEGKRECPRTIAVGGRKFKVYGGVSRASGYDGAPSVATAYWVDVTEYDATREEYTASRPVTAIIAIDNYEDLVNNLNERAKSQMLSEIDAKISAWTGDTSGFLRRYDRDKYLFMFEERHLDAFIRGKFSVLEDVRGISGDAGAHASLAIGIGRGAKTFEEGARFAQLALEMALSRGGDQAVIKNRLSFEFFGGNQAAAEKRTKVRSRVMSNALGELMSDSSSVFVMGHRMSDFDSVGAAAGVCAIARSRGKQAYIVVDRFATLAAAQLDHLKSHETYAETFISSEEAIIRADSRTLLVVVDTSRPEEVQSKDLLLSCTRVAVIDHHRRAATYVENAALTYTEQYASSACELVTEMLQYLVEPKEILKVEAEALLMGIILD
ncbi:MAG: DHH family phosphoesterase, partial [Oscillospiraceae bacterium]|nr:DHH family phosphoesterase [Oscillospiraceae bacterium]